MNMSLGETVQWFLDLKAQGVSKEEILDVLEFDSDQYPDMDILKRAKEIAYRSETGSFEANYVAALPVGRTIKKTYYDQSQYASILALDDGSYWVKKITTGVFFKCASYQDAKGLRQMIADRCGTLNF